jgi:hypothetical protein
VRNTVTVNVAEELNRASVPTECASDAPASYDMSADGVCDVRALERSVR